MNNLNGTWQQPRLEEIQGKPHPSTIKEIRVREMTPWMYCDDAKPVPKSVSGEKDTQCQVAEELHFDQYGMEIALKPIVRHKFYDSKQKKWNGDIAVSLISPQNFLTEATTMGTILGLKDRFGTAIAAYEKKLAGDPERAGSIPLVLMSDRIYPAVINACTCKDVTTINAFANADKPTLANVEIYLRQNGQIRMADNLKKFQEIAKQKLIDLGIETTKKAA